MKYKLDFYDKVEQTTTRRERVIVDANSVEQANDIAKDLPQYKKYDHLLISEYHDGVACYCIVVLGRCYINGKLDPHHKTEARLYFNCKNEQEAIRYYHKHYYGKYTHSYTFHSKDKLYDDMRTDGQDTKLDYIIDSYQFGSKRDAEWVETI